MSLSSAEAYSRLKGEATELLNDVGQSLASLLDAPASESHAEAHIDLTQQLGAFFGCYYKLRKRLERDCLSVAVLALTKSGKIVMVHVGLACTFICLYSAAFGFSLCLLQDHPTVYQCTCGNKASTPRSTRSEYMVPVLPVLNYCSNETSIFHLSCCCTCLLLLIFRQVHSYQRLLGKRGSASQQRPRDSKDLQDKACANSLMPRACAGANSQLRFRDQQEQ